MPIRRAVLFLAAIGAAPVAIAQALPTATQSNPTTAPMPVYEVISVKLDNPDQAPQMWASLQPDGYSAKGISLMFLLMYAYKIAPDYRIIGAPAWWNDNRYDIQAKVGDSDLPAFQELPYPQRDAMVQQVLTERFKLKVHRETRIQPIYSLVVARQGVLTEAPPPADGKPVGMGMMRGRGDRAGQMVFTDFTTAVLARNLSGMLGRMVVDNTGLTGQYHADLHWTPDRGPRAGSNPGVDAEELSIFTALPEQVGLKLVPTKGPVEVLVIDHVELPSEN